MSFGVRGMMFVCRLVRLLCLGGVICLVGLSAREAKGAQGAEAGEAVVIVGERLLNSLLEAIVALPSPPAYPLPRARAGTDGDGASACASQVVLARESMGMRTSVRFADGRITAPVAFRGSYDAALLGCLKFEGWADTSFDLAFDRSRQVLTARIQVRDVHLKNFPSLVTNGITGLVQDAIDSRLNPVEILRAEQLGTRLKVAPGSSLRLRAREVRHEVLPGELRLRIFYEVARGE